MKIFPRRGLFDKVLREKREGSLVAALDHAPLDGSFAVSMFPNAETIGVLFQRNGVDPGGQRA